MGKFKVSQTTAYYLQQKLYQAISEQRARYLFGQVEADEAYVGPKGNTDGRGTEKETVLGAVEERDEHAGQLRLPHVPSAHKANLQPPGFAFMWDQAPSHAANMTRPALSPSGSRPYALERDASSLPCYGNVDSEGFSLTKFLGCILNPRSWYTMDPRSSSLVPW